MPSLAVRRVEPAFHTRPEYVKTLGPEVVEICELAGYSPDVHQRMILDDLFAVRDDGKNAMTSYCIICNRQNLKTAVLKMACLGWLFVTEERLVIWSAHEVKTSKESHRDLATLIQDTPALSKQLKPGRTDGIMSGNGGLSIELLGDRRVNFTARSKDAGRGLSGDRVVLDEAYALAPEIMGALLPTLSARPNPQVVYASSAARPESDYLRDRVASGRSGKAKGSGYIEWCSTAPCEDPECRHIAPGKPGHLEGCVADNLEERVKANPSMVVVRANGAPGLSPELLEIERDDLPPSEYMRERMGHHDQPGNGDPILPPGVWSGLAAPGVAPDAPALAFDVSPARSWASIAAAGRLGDDGGRMVEVTGDPGNPVEADRSDARQGTDWLVPRLVEIWGRGAFDAVRYAKGSAAESFVPELERHGVRVEAVSQSDVQAACGFFFDEAVRGRLKHLDQPILNAAVMAARKDERPSGFIWGRRKSSGDITPLYAATLALWAVSSAKPRVESGFIPWNEL